MGLAGAENPWSIWGFSLVFTKNQTTKERKDRVYLKSQEPSKASTNFHSSKMLANSLAPLQGPKTPKFLEKRASESKNPHFSPPQKRAARVGRKVF